MVRHMATSIVVEVLGKAVLSLLIRLSLLSMNCLYRFKKPWSTPIFLVSLLALIALPYTLLGLLTIFWSVGKLLSMRQIISTKIFNIFVMLLAKSPIGINLVSIIFSRGVSDHIKNGIKHIFPVPEINEHSIHLGHPLILPAKDRAATYNFVEDKFRSKLSCYKANKMTHAAKLTLINSVFASIPVYYMSTILFSKNLIAKLNNIIRNFWWSGVRDEPTSKSLCLRAWRDICVPKAEGGLGIRNIQAMNRSLILSAAWRLAENPDSHLVKFLKSEYIPDTSIW